jgi:hypothetical protein
MATLTPFLLHVFRGRSTVATYGSTRSLSSRRLEREAQRNVEMMWQTGRLAPDIKTIAGFGKDNGAATDPDARSMATSGKDTGTVGHNVQAAVDAKHHLIVAYEVTNIGDDRNQLSPIAKQAQAAIGAGSDGDR